MPASAQATFCATLVDEWARAGVTQAVIAPGSRSTPLALALTADIRIRVHVFHDERAAAFAALGIALSTGVPAVLLCTSGTAAAHFHAAVVEADLACVPMLVCTADRPPELRDVGAPQAIDQRDLYGRAVRWYFDPGVADDTMRAAWRSIASEAYLRATGLRPGAVHLNLPFREPLANDVGELPAGRDNGRPWSQQATQQRTSGTIASPRLLAVGQTPDDVPLIADTAAGHGIAHADLILRHSPTAARLRPDTIVRVGRPPASRVVNEWLASTGAIEHVVSAASSDPLRTASFRHEGPPPSLESSPDYRRAWEQADAAAEAAIVETLGGFDAVTEPATARATVAALASGSHLVVASSMPVRDVEWYAPRRADVTVHANRGANGIDGTIATGIGVALATAAPTTVLLGDIAFLHDSSALIAVARRDIDLTLVVVDNDGGGIFSFLPQATQIAAERFETVFGTPHGVRPEAIAAAHGIDAVTVEDPASLEVEIANAATTGGVTLVVVRTDRAANVKVHDTLNGAVARALR